MIIVTGAAGFIGSCIVARLNEEGYTDLILVDHMPDNSKQGNLDQKKYVKYYDKIEFIDLIRKSNFKDKVSAVIHMGACSSTTLQDKKYFTENNLEYTKTLALWAINKNIRFIYASSAATYGDGSVGYKDNDETVRLCKPLNLYGESKQDFDLWALDKGLLDRIVGLKFFNVFGPNEYHKGGMRSVVAKSYQNVADQGKIQLFKSYKKDFSDGEQKRDFIYVKDAADIVMYFLKNPDKNGLFNVGTGKARTWNDLANALFSAVGKKPNITYVDMPDILREQYQYFTEADMKKLRNAGYKKNMTTLEEAVKDYVQYLKVSKHW
ncbi:MAG: ADP-glyceromanno-heptose 6-epimerase [Candidatus Omnitrophica bacterium]|nr:ADP-glyceromanno-heptose 6-epimerase [Candidatus Omnitrophota bacterium]